jgi:ankyrin repeat protein
MHHRNNSCGSGNNACIFAANCDKDKADEDDLTPLCAAASVGRNEVVRLLVGAGCDKDKPNKNGTTPLYIAATKGHEEVVRALLDANCDMSVMNTKILKSCGENIKELFNEKYKNRFVKFILGQRDRSTAQVTTLYDNVDLMRMVMDVGLA